MARALFDESVFLSMGLPPGAAKRNESSMR